MLTKLARGIGLTTDDSLAAVKAFAKKKHGRFAPVAAVIDKLLESPKVGHHPWLPLASHVLQHPAARISSYPVDGRTGKYQIGYELAPGASAPDARLLFHYPDHVADRRPHHHVVINTPTRQFRVTAPVESRQEFEEAHEAHMDNGTMYGHYPPRSYDLSHLPETPDARLSRRTVPVGDADTLPLLEAHPSKGVKAGRVTTPLLALADLLHERHGHEPVGKWITHTLTKPGVKVKRWPPFLGPDERGTVEYSINEHRPDEGMTGSMLPANTPRGVYHVVHVNHPRHRLTIYAPATHAAELHEAAADLAGDRPTVAAKAREFAERHSLKLSRDRRVPLDGDQAALVAAHGKKKRPTAPLLALADWMMEKHSDAPAGKWFAHVLTHPKARVIYRGRGDTSLRPANVSVQPILQVAGHPDEKHGITPGVWHRLDIKHPKHSVTVYAPVDSRPELHEAVDDFVHPNHRDAAHATADAWADEHGLAAEVPQKLARVRATSDTVMENRVYRKGSFLPDTDRPMHRIKTIAALLKRLRVRTPGGR